VRFVVRSVVLLFTASSLVAVVVGCSFHRHSTRQKSSETHAAGLDFIAANAAFVLQGRRVAFSFGPPDVQDIWVSAHGRVFRVSKRVREAVGDNVAELPSLSPDGRYIAFFTEDTGSPGEAASVFVMRSDGSHAHQVGGNLGLGPYGAGWGYWPPSWDRNSRSFVLTAYTPGLDPNSQEERDFDDDDLGLVRVHVASGKATWLTPIGVDTYNVGQAVVSPDGRKIAYLRSVAQEPSAMWLLGTVSSYVYVMRANGGAEDKAAPTAAHLLIAVVVRQHDPLCRLAGERPPALGEHLPPRPPDGQGDTPAAVGRSHIYAIGSPLTVGKLCGRRT